jgi:hypothetical protein
MSIDRQASFWRRNVCELSDDIKKEAHIPQDLSEGLEAYGSLLKRIYGDDKSFELSKAGPVPTKIGIPADDLENYHYLTDTALCLYHLALTGEARADGGTAYLHIDKSTFQKSFKTPASFYLEMLQKYSFYYRLYKKGKDVSSYTAADAFDVFYDDGSMLPAAMKHLIERLPDADVKKDYGPSTAIFLMADYASMLCGNSIKRDMVSPLRPGILSTLGSKAGIWRVLIESLSLRLSLQTDISVNTYVFPCWSVRFISKKKTVCTLIVQTDSIVIRLPLSYDAAKRVIDRRIELPQGVRDSIERFGCVMCGKCKQSENIEIFRGYRLCRLNYSNFVTEDSRMIQMSVDTPEDASVLCDICLS